MQRLLRTYYVTMLCALCATGSLDAVAATGELPPQATVQEDEEPVRVSLVTFYPGSEPHNIFGHSEVRVRQGTTDLYFNYGVFDFQSSGFLWRFVLGQTDYLCVAVPRAYATEGMEGRRMVEQELNLPQDRAIAVRDFLWNNAQPQNRVYRYKYLSDNCSTRPRDIIEMAAGESLRYPEMGDTTVTYRDILSRYCANYAWERFGIDMVLGWDIDTALDRRATLFIPMLLMEATSGATISTGGVSTPLVGATTVPIDASTAGKVKPPTPWWLTPLAVAILVLAVTLVISCRDWSRQQLTHWLDALLFGMGGLAGCLLLFLMVFSTHEATTHNINIVWLNPLLLLLAVLPWFRRMGGVSRRLHGVYALVLALLMLLWPFQPQVANIAFFPLMAALLLRSLANAGITSQPTRGPTRA